MNDAPPLLELRAVSKFFGSTVALDDISLKISAGEVHCLLGDNGAGKSTLIKILSGVHRPDSGQMLMEGEETVFTSPRAARERGIATVFQDLAMAPLMSISRNFFLGREPVKKRWPYLSFDVAHAADVTRQEMIRLGIDIRDPNQLVGTLSGGERQCVAIARALYFGAKVLILDEPTSALGVHQAGEVLRFITQTKSGGVGVIFITHNINHAYPVGDVFTLLNRGRSLGTFRKSEISREEVLRAMSGGEALADLHGGR
ncbi:MAG: ATP-binding cassette domain-containing protein [Parvibaculaceae bacterium]